MDRGKNDRGLWSLSTAEHFASSFLTSAGSDFYTYTQNALTIRGGVGCTPRMHKASTGPNAH